MLSLAACSPAGEQQASGANPDCFRRSTDMVGGPFELVGSDGRTLTQKDFAGRKALVFFGYLVILLTGFGLQIITAM